MAEPRGRDSEAVEVKSAGPREGCPLPLGGTGGLPRKFFEKMVPFGAF